MTPEQTLYNFQKWVVWALLPCQCPVANRKSWTGADVAIQWTGLLDAHWGLVPKIILRLLKPDRPLGGSKDMAAAASRTLAADPAVGDMSQFDALLQDMWDVGRGRVW